MKLRKSEPEPKPEPEPETDPIGSFKHIAALLKRAQVTDPGMPRVIAITELLTVLMENFECIEILENNALFRSTVYYKCNEFMCEALCTPELEHICRVVLEKIKTL